MKADHVGLSEHLIQAGKGHAGRGGRFLRVGGAGQDLHPKGQGNPGHGGADVPIAHQPHGLARQLHEGGLPETKLVGPGPLPVPHRLVVEGHLGAQLQQQGKDELGH